MAAKAALSPETCCVGTSSSSLAVAIMGGIVRSQARSSGAIDSHRLCATKGIAFAMRFSSSSLSSLPSFSFSSLGTSTSFLP